MATFLFNEIIFGPLQSRRLGVSLGVNLLPIENKLCSFDCIYCECGWNPDTVDAKGKMPSRALVREELEKKLIQMKDEGKLPDVITFAGNGEPTLHRDFSGVIDDTIFLRDQLCPEARIAVLSNSTTIQNQKTFDALLRIDDNILKLDSVNPKTMQLIDQPCGKIDVDKLISNLQKFNGKCTIQTLFVKGEHNGQVVDNTTEEEVHAWIEALKIIRPEQVMIYTIARDTPAENLQKVSVEEMKEIGLRVKDAIGIDVQISG